MKNRANRFGSVERAFLGVAVIVVVLVAIGLLSHPNEARPTGAVLHRAPAAPSSSSPPDVIRLSSIAGNVTDAASKAVVGARVCAVPPAVAAASTAATCAETDAHGLYIVHGLPAGSYLVTAARPGFVTGSAQQGRPVDLVVDVPLTGVDIVLQPGGARVTGVVVDATGGPVPHATIPGERTVPPRAAVDVEADDMGRFTLWFPPGPLILSAQADGYAPARWNGPAPSVDVRLALTPGATVRGIVVSSQAGEPPPNIEVRAAPSRNPSSPLSRSSTTGPEGTFEIRGIEPGSYTLIATGDGWRGQLPEPIRLGLASTVENIRVQVGPATQITGRVLVASTLEPCQEGVVGLGPLDPDQAPPEDDEVPSRLPSRPSFSASIGAKGEVHFRAVARGRYSVRVRCSGHVLRDGPRTVDVGSAALSDLIWKVGRGLSLTVLTVDEVERAIPGAELYLRFPRGLITRGRTDDQGRYDVRAELAAGTYEVRSPPPFEAVPVQVELHDGDRPVTAKLRMGGSASIVTTVRERGGGPVDGLAITAVAQPGAGSDAVASPPSAPPSAHTFTAIALGEGRYRIAPLRPGRYEVRADDGVNATVRTSHALVVGEAAEVSIEIDRGGQIRGHVVDDDGAPVPDVWVSASTPVTDGDRAPLLATVLGGGLRALTDREGRFVLERLGGEGTAYTIRVDEPGGSAAVKEGARIGDPDVVIALRAAGTLSGTVVGACGSPAEHVVLQAVSQDTMQSRTQELGGAGEQPFRVTLAPGHVRLMAFCRDNRSIAQLTTELGANDNVTGLRLVLEAPSASTQGLQ